MGKRFQLTGASVIVYRDGKILLQRRRDNGCWGYHGGAVELGEAVEHAAKRELLEETGLIADSLALYGVFSGKEQHMVYPDGNEAEIIDIVYLCEKFHGEEKGQESELADLKWFDIDDIPEKLSPPIKSTLLQFIREKKACLSR